MNKIFKNKVITPKKVITFLVSTILLTSLNLFAAEGENIVFDTSMNGGQPLNYKRLGCLIHRVKETFRSSGAFFQVYDVHDATFEASGDLNACKTVCANYNDSFATPKSGLKVT